MKKIGRKNFFTKNSSQDESSQSNSSKPAASHGSSKPVVQKPATSRFAFSRSKSLRSKSSQTIATPSAEIIPATSQSKFPAVSVIIPLYNAEKFIGECLNSLLKQTFQDFEVIVIDDCSTDKSVAIIQDYAPKFGERFKFSSTKSNSGGKGYIPRNIGLNLAKGEYVFFIDADDFIADNALEKLHATAKEYDADVVYMGAYYNLNKPNGIKITHDGKDNSFDVDKEKATLTFNNPNKNIKRFLLLKRHFPIELNNVSDKDIYKILYREFAKENDSADLIIPFIFSDFLIQRSLNPEFNLHVKELKEEISQRNYPAVSVIIPMYNAEQYIGEALESILAQTFQSFEVIVVDDCSKDSSYEVVKSYIPKFDGRLKLLSMGKNSGSAPAPRNKGFLFSRGEYIFFMDADDMFTETALEEMYSLAKEYKADAVYCEKYYMSSGMGKDFLKNMFLANEKNQEPPFVDKPTLEVENMAQRIKKMTAKNYWVTPWQRLVSRELLAENKITFPEIIGCDDVVWCFEVLCCAKRFLRVPNACYIRRMSNESFTRSKKPPNRVIHQWADVTVRGLKFVNNFMNKIPFFQENPNYRYEAFASIARSSFQMTYSAYSKLKPEKIYDIFLNEFAKDTGDNDVLVAFLCTRICEQNKDLKKAEKQLKTGITASKNAQISSAKSKDEIICQKGNLLLANSLSQDFSPAVSVVIPLYNSEELIGECLDSLLIQTFQDFEVIVADDCSTDNSVEIVESYAPKFNGRLQITQTENNSGGGGYIPRNIGLDLAKGEYVIFLDSDDFLLGNALETLYKSAKKYDVDVVYSSIYYDVKQPNDVYLHRDGLGRKYIKDGIEDTTTLTVDNRDKILQELMLPGTGEGNFRAPWSKFVRRKFLIENKIFFPDIVTGGDCVWVMNVYAYAKRFLRLPIPLYFYRRYNTSITRTERTASEQLTYWVAAFIAFLKALNNLQSRVEILRENPNYCYEATRGGHFEWCLNRTSDARKELSNKEIYEILYREFSKEKDLFEAAVPFFFSIIDNERKSREDDMQTVKDLRKEVNKLKKSIPAVKSVQSKVIQPSFSPSTCAVSVIVSLYNYEKYIGECLDSLLAQTFKDFEVIVVDDCSTDNGFSIVESYISQFDGRLKLTKTAKNTGGGGEPRNIGLSLSSGEYCFFMDADDVLTKTALEEMYTLAKKFNADTVYCERYFISEGIGQQFKDNIHISDIRAQKPPYVDKPTLDPEDLAKRINMAIDKRYWVTAWLRLVQRKLLIENNITFSCLIASNDADWTFKVLFCSKRFLRVPNICYIRRIHNESVSFRERTTSEYVHKWMDRTMRSMKDMDNFMSEIEFFKENPKFRHKILNHFVNSDFANVARECSELSAYDIYDSFRKEFGDYLGDYDVLVSCLCADIVMKRRSIQNYKNRIAELEDKLNSLQKSSTQEN